MMTLVLISCVLVNVPVLYVALTILGAGGGLDKTLTPWEV